MSTLEGTRPIGRQRGPGFAIVLTIVTLGIYGLYWTYKSFQEVRDYRGEGLNGIVGVLTLFIIAGYFLLPQAVGRMHVEDGRQNPPVSGVSGFWILVPYVGLYIWIYKIQTALNDFWGSKGAPSPGVPVAQQQTTA